MPHKTAYCFGNIKNMKFLTYYKKELDLVHGLYTYAKSYHMSFYLKHGTGMDITAYFSQCWKYEELASTVNTPFTILSAAK
jgi:hypothetical protein